ncbi:hypothetical protein [Labedaea rhizosphaerae]|uniref:Uncharacterized protein n=1 Tax=Labedaea rhizosphaerae TaxID=598644 RepID=A0A4R6SNA3_LABRH|nr:hypothetical protein [Labedaea rhizosphaerae]TDQ05391.1 hypothetical protein EV186_1011361 [Labedaea rhizosphaerae]
MTTPYPPQHPPQYPPPPPLPPRRKVWPWVVFPLVAVLVAAGVVTAVLASDDEKTAGSPSKQANGCTSGYCVGSHPYANACQALAPDGAWQLFPGSPPPKLRITETFADPLPASMSTVESACEVAPLDAGSPIQWILLHLRENATPATVEPGTGTGVPLAEATGVPGAMAFDHDEQVDAHWVHGNVSVKLTMSTERGKPRVDHAQLGQLVRKIDSALTAPKGPAEPVPGGTRGDAKVYTDACEVFAGNDFQKATGYVVNPGYVEREYSYPEGYDEQLGSTCHRYTARADSGYPKPPGTTYLDGLLAPEVTVFPTPDKATAAERLADDKVQLGGAVDVPGVGDAAVFGGSGTLEFVKGFHVVRLSNTPSDGPTDDLRATLTALAKAIAARMT